MKSWAPDAERVQVLLVTVDPERDTPDRSGSTCPRLMRASSASPATRGDAEGAKPFRIFFEKAKTGESTRSTTARRASCSTRKGPCAFSFATTASRRTSPTTCMSLRARILLLVLLATLAPSGLRSGSTSSSIATKRRRGEAQPRGACEVRGREPGRQGQGHGAAAARPVARARPRHAGQGRLLGVSRRRARALSAVHGAAHHHAGRRPALRFAALGPQAERERSATTSGRCGRHWSPPSTW